MPSSTIFIETQRLWIRPFTQTDLHPFVNMRADPDIARYQSWSTYSQADGYLFILDMAQSLPGTPGEWYQFAIALRPSNQFIGDCALYTEADGRCGEMGYSLAAAYQRQGYASEAISALLHYVHHSHKLQQVTAVTDSRNQASIALLQKLNFQRQKEEPAWFKGQWTTEYHYSLSLAQQPLFPPSSS